jgi:hypothetical protein
MLAAALTAYIVGCTYISEFGFFFFLRIAVAVSSTCGGLVGFISTVPLVKFTSLCSPPDGSLRLVSIRIFEITLGVR